MLDLLRRAIIGDVIIGNQFNVIIYLFQVNVDIVSFGESEDNEAKLNAFINTLNGKDVRLSEDSFNY